MKTHIVFLIITLFCFSCKEKVNKESSLPRFEEKELKIEGTWKLIYGEIKEKDSIKVKDLSKTDFIKIINKTHFAFFNQNKETSEGFYGGGGSYTLKGNVYKEKLAYVAVEAIRNHEFTFNVKIIGDTLIQYGKEEVKEAGMDRDIVEKYIRIKL